MTTAPLRSRLGINASEPRASASGRRRSESGFALLLIFVLAAGIAIFMLNQLPRVCFETQRDREEMLIQRGEQYKRAIGLYVRKWGRYPAKIEDLENTNNIRYLRRRYIDPMTGKDEWRIVHAGPGGMLTDSLVQKAGAAIGPDGKPIQGTPGMPGASGMNSASGMNVNPGNTGATTGDPNQPAQVNDAVKARPSDRPIGQPGMQQSGMLQPGQPGYDPSQPNNQANQGYNPNFNPYYGYSTAPQGATGATTYQQQPGQPGNPQQQLTYPGQPGYVQPGQPGSQQANQSPFAQPGMAQPGVQLGNGVPQQFPQPGAFVPVTGAGGPVTSGAQQTTAAQMIQQILTQPRPMPANLAAATGQNPVSTFGGGGGGGGGFGGGGGGFGGTSQGSGFGGTSPDPSTFNNSSGQSAPSSFNNQQAGGGGIAGVATKYKGPSIKIYDDRQKYQEWEFVYDPRKEAMKQVQGGQGQGTSPGIQPGSGTQSGFGQTGTQSGFGQTGTQSGFGQTGSQSGFSQPTTQPVQPPSN
jgi:uncharacterized membrane protein YgcG